MVDVDVKQYETYALEINQILNSHPQIEEYLIQLINATTNDERQAIREFYDYHFQDTGILNDLRTHLKGDFKTTIIGLFLTPVEYDCHQLRKAWKNFSIDDDLIFEIITSRPHWMLQQIEEEYQKIYNKSLRQEIERTYPEDIRRCLYTLLDTERSRNETPDINYCKELADKLVKAEDMKWTDKKIFDEIFAICSPEELVLIGREYYQSAGRIIVNAIESQMSGKYKKLFRELMYALVNPCELYSEKLKRAIKGLGMDDNLLQRILITRHMIDMFKIRDFYEDKFGVTLVNDIEEETKEHYKDLLVTLVNKQPSQE